MRADRLPLAALGAVLGLACASGGGPSGPDDDVTGRPVGSVQLQSLSDGDGVVFLPFENGSQAFAVIIESVDLGADLFTTRVTASATAGVQGRVLGGATEAGPPHLIGESLIRALERRWVAALPHRTPRRPGRALATAQELGSMRAFHVINTVEATNPTDPGSFDEVTAVLRYIGEHTLVYVDERTPAANLPDLTIHQIGQRFDGQTFQTDVAAFGLPSDIDGNGKVIILLTPTVNGLTTPEIFAQGALFAGFFAGIDLLPDPILNPFANGGEVFYAVIPDPDAEFGAARFPLAVMVDFLSGTFAHEFEHMISFNQHVFLRGGFPEALWLDEGLAHMAETLNGFDDSNRLRSTLFLARPQMTMLVGGEDTLEKRGAAWLFIQYLADRFGESILSELVQTRLTSTSNVDAAAGRPFATLFHEWAATLLLDGTGLSSDPTFDLPSVALRPEFERGKQELNATRPGRVTTEYLDIASVTELPGASLAITQESSSLAYLEFTASAATNARIVIDGAPGSRLQVTVVRTR